MTELRPCPACGCEVFSGPYDSQQPCPECGWRDDFAQLVHPDLVVGANHGLSLREAQQRASSLQPSAHPRSPAWRPLHPGEHPPEGNSASPVCSIGTPDPADVRPYWLTFTRPNR